MRLRAAKDRLKVEHSIIGDLREVLEDLLARHAAIHSIIPGRIRPVRDAKGPVKIRITTPTQTGWKGIGLASGARQELFFNTRLSKEEMEKALGPVLKA
jgi:hypothetical protein